MKTYTGILLAGGLSSRMKTEKGLLVHQGKRLIEYALEALQSVCSEVILSSNTQSFDYLNLRKCTDLVEKTGPIGGIYSCLKSSVQKHHLVLACDMPLVDADVLKSIVAQIDEYDMILPAANGQVVPVCGYYNQSLLPLIESEIAQGHYSLYRLLDKCRSLVFETDEVQARKLVNVNTPEEFAALIDNRR